MNKWNKYQEEPVILTLSSDEDEDEEESLALSNYKLIHGGGHGQENYNATLERINPKEPLIEPDSDYTNYKRFHNELPGGILNKDAVKNKQDRFRVSFSCRYLRIGSYKVIPQDDILFSYKGIQVKVQPLTEGNKNPVTLVFKMNGILKVLAHLAQALPVFFVYTTPSLAMDIRTQLKMTDKNGFYFDPCSQEESQRRVTLLLEKIKADSIQHIKDLLNINLYNIDNAEQHTLFEELSQKDANEILVKSSPGEVDSVIQNSKASSSFPGSTALLVFPPPPNKGGISITMDDYMCLKEEEFLNDVLIDFYLKWLHICHLSDKNRERTHIFSTFFYKRLTAKPKMPRRSQCYEDNSNLTSSQRRHARVKSWTKNVDIFSKDFILIPINEHAHWFLAVVCFPYLNGPVRVRDGKPLPKAEAAVQNRLSTRPKKKVEIPVIDDEDWSDRDEAEGDENELDCDDDTDGFLSDDNQQSQPPKKKSREQLEPLIQPSIFIFDSLSGSSRARIIATLRDYLAEEHLQRKGFSKTFSKETMRGACPKVPQQMNFSDCGLYTLQFAESFFEDPLKDFRIPVPSLAKWFQQDLVCGKRAAIAKLIRSLVEKYKPHYSLILPSIHSNSFSTKTHSDDGLSSTPQSETEEQNHDHLLSQLMATKKSNSESNSKSKPKKMKSNHSFPSKFPDNSSNFKNKVSITHQNDQDSPQEDAATRPQDMASSIKHSDSRDRSQEIGSSLKNPESPRPETRDQARSIVSSVKHLAKLKREKWNTEEISTKKSNKKVIHSLQLLQESYGMISNDSDDEIFPSKSELSSQNTQPYINIHSLSKCTR